ncbi:MAG: hypothetical protein H0T89_26295 [Deltaproteobacteria bacterium]|nr:hypothetical protein [Deltaproteobacteria bacterium]
MPKRTNKKQQIVEMLKKLLAPQGCTVTPSKFLIDTKLNVKREVDVVAEMTVDGHVFTQCFEIVGRTRPADLIWVEGIVRKHESLVTDRLYLVSWSGFSEDALRLAQMTPRTFPITVEPAAGAATLYADQVNVRLKRVSPRVQASDGKIMGVEFHPDITVFAADGSPQGTIWQLGSWIIQLPALGQPMIELAHSHPRRQEMRWFEFNLPLAQPPFDNLWLRFEADARTELQRMVAVNLQGEFEFAQERVDLSMKTFAENVFGHGEAVLGGVRHLLVAAMDESMAVNKVHVEADKTSPTRKVGSSKIKTASRTPKRGTRKAKGGMNPPKRVRR